MTSLALALLVLLNVTYQLRAYQLPLDVDRRNFIGSGALSEWAGSIKRQFLSELSEGRANEWLIVMGNEAGDTDSMAAAIGWAYHLNHLIKDPQKAISLLQTVEDALDLRPENQLALERANMSSRHPIDELPIKPFELSRHLGGIVLVDHNVPTTGWHHAPVISILDHHVDMHVNLSAHPRYFDTSASCSSLVTKLILDADDKGKHFILGGGIPDGLLALLMRAIALDSAGLKSSRTRDVDRDSALRLFRRASIYDAYIPHAGPISQKHEWRALMRAMANLKDEMAIARDQLSALDLRDLLRRDWKANSVQTQSLVHPVLTIGIGSIPYSLQEQIQRTPEKTTPEWFAVERAFTSEIGADVSVILSKFRSVKTNMTEQNRELVVVVAHGWGKRLSNPAATDLFDSLCKAVEEGLEGLRPWKRPDGRKLLPRRMAWEGLQANRKVVMPLVQDAARKWAYDQDES